MRSLALASAILLAATPESVPPVDLGVTEETGTTLGQVDVTLTGPPEALAQVQADSFRVFVRGKRVERTPHGQVSTALWTSPDPRWRSKASDPLATPFNRTPSSARRKPHEPHVRPRSALSQQVFVRSGVAHRQMIVSR